MRSPLALVAGCFALGIALARPEHAGPPGQLSIFGTALCLLAGLVALRAGRRTPSFVAALAGFLAAGATAAALFQFRFPLNHVSHLAARGSDTRATIPARLEGVLVSSPSRSAIGLLFDVEARRVKTGGQFRSSIGRVRLHVENPDPSQAPADARGPHLQYGDSIRAPVRLRRPRVYRNPGNFDARRWMESIEDIYWLGTIRNPLLVEKLPGSRRLQLAGLFDRTRRRLLEAIDRLFPPWAAEGRNGAVLKAILLGDRSSLDSDTVENFRKVGLYHLLVIAGLHVGLLAMLAGFFLGVLGVPESWRSAWVFVFLLGYAFLVEQRAATLRASIMISAYLLGRFLYRQHAALNAIGLAALLLLLDRPAWLFESGFQLSFSAVLVIVTLVAPVLERTTEPYRRSLWQLHDPDLDRLFAPRQAQFRLDLRDFIQILSSRVPPFGRHPRISAALVTIPAKIALWAANMLLFSAILQMGLLLPMALTFHRVSFAGIGLNALAIPVMTILLALALPVVVLTGFAPILAPWLARALVAPMRAVFAMTDLPNLPAWLSYRVPEPPRWVAWGFVFSAIITTWTLGRRRRAFWLSLGALGAFALLVSLHPFPPRLPRGVLEMTALDCGRGDAVFLVLPDRTTLLADACGSGPDFRRDGQFQGRRWDPGEDVVSPYLWSRGVKKLDIVLLADGRELQRAGLGAVLRNFPVGEFWTTANPVTRFARGLVDDLRRHRIPIHPLSIGDRIERGGVSFEVLWTPVGPVEPSRSASLADSVVVRAAYGESSLLISGALNSRVEESVARSPSHVESGVLEVAHRTSALNPEFLARVAPRILLASGESGGSRGPAAFDKLDGFPARVFHTERDGAVTVEMNRSAIFVHTYRMSAGEGTATEVPSTLTLSVP